MKLEFKLKLELELELELEFKLQLVLFRSRFSFRSMRNQSLNFNGTREIKAAVASFEATE